MSETERAWDDAVAELEAQQQRRAEIDAQYDSARAQAAASLTPAVAHTAASARP